MRSFTLWLLAGLTVCVSGQSNNALLSVLISDAVSIFTSITSAVGSQVSAASTANLAPTTSDGSSSATSTTPATSSSTTATSSSSISSSPTAISSSSISSLSSITSAGTVASSSASPVASGNANDGHHDRNLAIILGTVLGALVLGFLILFMLLLCRRRRRRSNTEKRYKAYNSSSEDIVVHEKNSRHQRRSSSFGRQPKTFQQYHRGPQNMHKPDRYPTGIPAAHGMSDDPFVPGVSTHQHDGRMHDHEHGMFLNVDDKHLDNGHYERVPLAVGSGEAVLGGNSRGYQRTSQAPSIGPDAYPHNFAEPPPRSPLRRSMESNERRRRSASLSREATPTPHRDHDPMPRPAGLAVGAGAGSLPQRDRRRTRSQPRYSDPVPSGFVSPIMKSEESKAVHEIGDSSDDRDIDRLRRTGTLSQGPKSRPNVAELHELSSTGSSNVVPTLANLGNNHNNVDNHHRQSYPPYSSVAAPVTGPIASLHPAPLDESQWMNKHVHEERPTQIIPARGENVNQRANPLGSHPVAEADPVKFGQNQTATLQQGNHNTQLPEGSLLVSGILNIIDQSNAPPTQPNATTRPLSLNRTSTEERRKIRAKRRSGPEFKPPIASGSSSSNTEPISPQYPSQHYPNFTIPRPTSQSNISQPLRLKPSQQAPNLFSSETTLNSNPAPNAQPRPQLVMSKPGQEYSNIPDQGAIGRWNSRGRWKSTENIHDDVVGQAM